MAALPAVLVLRNSTKELLVMAASPAVLVLWPNLRLALLVMVALPAVLVLCEAHHADVIGDAGVAGRGGGAENSAASGRRCWQWWRCPAVLALLKSQEPRCW